MVEINFHSEHEIVVEDLENPERYNAKNGNNLWWYHRMVAFNDFLTKKRILYPSDIIAAVNRYLMRTITISKPLSFEFFDFFITKLIEEKATGECF